MVGREFGVFIQTLTEKGFVPSKFVIAVCAATAVEVEPLKAGDVMPVPVPHVMFEAVIVLALGVASANVVPEPSCISHCSGRPNGVDPLPGTPPHPVLGFCATGPGTPPHPTCCPRTASGQQSEAARTKADNLVKLCHPHSSSRRARRTQIRQKRCCQAIPPGSICTAADNPAVAVVLRNGVAQDDWLGLWRHLIDRREIGRLAIVKLIGEALADASVGGIVLDDFNAPGSLRGVRRRACTAATVMSMILFASFFTFSSFS